MTQISSAALHSASWPVAALLLLADGRFPAGSHAHSGGVEAAVTCGRVHDIPTLEAFLRGRAATAGLVAAAFAAASCLVFRSTASGPITKTKDDLLELDVELEARIPSSALRAVSRKLGRQLQRALCAVRPDSRLEILAAMFPIGPHQPIASGAGAAVVGLDPSAAALAAVYESVTGPATAAIRLLGLNPFDVYALLTRLAAEIDGLAVQATGRAAGPLDELPPCNSPLLDILAEHHAHWEARLFAS
ncbi:urease accessory protein UreF [Nitrospira sp. Nam74]